MCGKFGSLWPQPTKDVNIGPKLAVFHIDDLAVKFDTSKLVSIEVRNKQFYSTEYNFELQLKALKNENSMKFQMMF